MFNNQLVRFVIVGVVSNATLLGLFWVAITFGIAPLVAVSVTYALGLISSLLLNGKWTFGTLNRQTAVDKTAKFTVLYGAGYLFSVGAFWAISFTGIPHVLNQFLVMGSCGALLFLGQKFWVFNEAKS
jgi:putative flippase GtrA